MENLVIIGSGPAGYTAGIYSSRAMLKPLLVTGRQPGGQLTTTTEIENFPGFVDGILGAELMGNLKKQAERFGTRVTQKAVSKVSLVEGVLNLVLDDNSEVQTKAMIIATGASAIYLGLDSETKLKGKGVSGCATCDGFFFKDKHVVVIGGGDSAIEEALFLTRFASKVTMIHRRDELRASKIMQQKAFDNVKLDILWDSIVTDVLDVEKETVTGVVVKNVKSNLEEVINCDGVFPAIGHRPNTEVFKDFIELDKKGYIIIKKNTTTSLSGVFAAGDVVDTRYRQAITAAGMGCMAAIDAEKYLASI